MLDLVEFPILNCLKCDYFIYLNTQIFDRSNIWGFGGISGVFNIKLFKVWLKNNQILGTLHIVN